MSVALMGPGGKNGNAEIVEVAYLSIPMNHTTVTTTITGYKKYWILRSQAYGDLITVSIDKGTLSETKKFGWQLYQDVTGVSPSDVITVSGYFSHNDGDPRIYVLAVKE